MRLIARGDQRVCLVHSKCSINVGDNNNNDVIGLSIHPSHGYTLSQHLFDADDM